MLNEIEIASKLSSINEKEFKENIVNSGRVQGINIYKEKINILIAKKKDETELDIIEIKKNINSLFENYEFLSVDIIESELKKSDITHLLNMSKVDLKEKS